jgi:hypothetical protein
MCYSVYISTDSAEDLTARNTELLRFKKMSELHPGHCSHLLEYPTTWFVGSKSECSCTFRHLHSVELGFGEPVDWYPEEPDSLAATGELYDTLVSLLSSESHVDLLDHWEGADCQAMTTMDVSIDEVSREAFRMFENHIFKLGTSRRPDPAEARQSDDPNMP